MFTVIVFIILLMAANKSFGPTDYCKYFGIVVVVMKSIPIVFVYLDIELD